MNAHRNVLAPLEYWSENSPTHALFVDDEGLNVTARHFYEQVLALAAKLRAHGINPSDRVALYAKTCYRWSVVDYAVLAAGAVTVPVYESSSSEQLRWILEDSGAKLIVSGTEELDYKVEELGLSILRWRFDSSDLKAPLLSPSQIKMWKTEHAQIDPVNLATIVYTSGTTGRPKDAA